MQYCRGRLRNRSGLNERRAKKRARKQACNHGSKHEKPVPIEPDQQAKSFVAVHYQLHGVTRFVFLR